jgi:hypothetical protein
MEQLVVDVLVIAASTNVQKITRFALSRFCAPVGSSISSADDVRHVMTHLMSDPRADAPPERWTRGSAACRDSLG